MARGGRGNADEEEITGGDAVIPSAALDALVASLTSAITTAVATAVASVATAPGASVTAQKVSTAIDPYDTEFMDLDSKEGKYHWKMVTEGGGLEAPLPHDRLI